MSDLIDQNRQRLQALFDPFNKGGSWMTLAEGEEAPLPLGIIDGYTVTRVTGADFWVHFKAVGYHEGFQHAHTVKMVDWSQDDTYLLDLVNDRGRRFHIELIFPDLEPDLAAGWNRWRAYKAANRQRFERIDAELLADHIEMADNWHEVALYDRVRSIPACAGGSGRDK